VKQLEAGTVPWHKPWSTPGSSGLPRNLVTGHEYRGINVWILLSSEFTSPYWLTFKQAKQLGGNVRKGERGTPVAFWKFGTREVQDGDEVTQRQSVLCRYYTVFNSEQCGGLRVQPAEPVAPTTAISPIEQCETIITDWIDKPNIEYGGSRASYSKNLDLVRVPERPRFQSAEEYYSTLFHELTHSTGHPERLNRQTLTDFEFFGDENYSREELVAELGAAYLCGFAGIENRTINNSAAYLASWLKVLKQDSRMLLTAASQAQKAVDLILGISREAALHESNIA
jgi:antirestriction protein ArdC